MDHNMEFEDNRPTSEADRRMAETKRLTLQPVHTDIRPEGLLDSEIVARHVNGPAIGNVSSDIEEATTYVQPTQSLIGNAAQPTSAPESRRLMLGVVGGIIIISGLTYLAFTL
jgi:hypothetical protein